MEMPILLTQRLRLRPFELADAAEVRRLAGAREIAATTQNIPHPYPEGGAEAWILTHPGAWERREALSLAVVRRADETLVGSIGLELALPDERAEIGYWIGVPYWGLGYATEGSRAIVAWAFEMLPIHRIHARHIASNPASGAVLRKLGMRREGTQRRQVVKWGVPDDLVLYGILREEFETSGRPAREAP